MKVKKVPLRSCIVTKERLEKRDLIRVVKTKEQEVLVDLTGKVNGRGAYLKKDLLVFEKAKKSNVLSRHLEIQVPDAIYEELNNLLK